MISMVVPLIFANMPKSSVLNPYLVIHHRNFLKRSGNPYLVIHHRNFPIEQSMARNCAHTPVCLQNEVN